MKRFEHDFNDCAIDRIKDYGLRINEKEEKGGQASRTPFTFHYGAIKTLKERNQKINEAPLHSTMEQLKPKPRKGFILY